jgi:energy-coupling factor transporter ATP-binding protein EcfA2
MVWAESSRKDANVKEIISRMHSYVIRRGEISWSFVDREREVRSIIARKDIVESGMITVLYGSKGCGKSTFFSVLSEAADQADSGLDVLVVERPEEVVEGAILHLPKSFRELGKSIAGYLRDSQISPDRAAIVSTSTIFGIAFTLASYIASRLRRGRCVLIVLNEVKADSPEHLSSFKQWLETFANNIKKYNRDYSEKGGSIAVVALTSDALAAKISEVVGNKVNWVLMWNLPRNASEKLISQIRLQHRVARELGISSEEAREILWRLAGGNPRELEQIWGMGILGWVKTTASRLGNIIDDAIRDLGEDLVWDNLERILEDVDGMGRVKIFNYLLRGNVTFYTNIGIPISELPREQWIGERYAYQIPAYYYILKTMAKKKSWDISPEEVIREAMG